MILYERVIPTLFVFHMQIHREQTPSVSCRKRTELGNFDNMLLVSISIHSFLNHNRPFPITTSSSITTVHSPSPLFFFQLQNHKQSDQNLIFRTNRKRKKVRDMKEGSEEVGAAKRKGVRSETEKHKTKMRERQRRAITTNIFLGLRKHGGYRLSPRADINQVLRHLANEAGWIVDPDGTTYRSSASILNRCSVCGTVRSTTPTSTSSAVAGGGGGENSTPASSCRLPDSVRDYAMAFNDNVIQPATPFYIPGGGGGGGTSSCSSSRNPTGNGNINGDVPLAVYMYGNEDVRCCLSASATVEICGGGGDGGGSKDTAYEAMREARASNQSTPEGSPRLRS